MSAFNEGLMTGAQLGQGAYRQRQAREVGGLMSGGNYAGAAAAAYGQGDLATGQAIGRFGEQQAATQRGQQITGALKTGDYVAATGFASSPEELAAITAFRESATEAERTAAATKAGNMAAAIQSVQGLPPEQQLTTLRERAPSLGIDPNNITPDVLGQLDTYLMQALGTKAFLEYQQDERAAQRPIIGNGFISLPPGSPMPGQSQPQALGATLPPGWTPVNPNQPASGQPARATSEMSQPSRVSFRSTDEAANSIRQLVPGVRLTSGTRSVAHNREVGGVPTSNHVRGRAWDLVPPGGMSMAQLASKMRSEGFRAIDEGDHVHVSW